MNKSVGLVIIGNETEEHSMRKRLFEIFGVPLVVVLITAPALSKGASKPDGAKLFAQYCSKCHVGGGNSVKPKHAIAGSKQLNNILVFKAYLNEPPGHMPYYQNLVKDKEQVQALYDFCKARYGDSTQKQSSKLSDELLAQD